MWEACEKFRVKNVRFCRLVGHLLQLLFSQGVDELSDGFGLIVSFAEIHQWAGRWRIS